MGRLERSWGIFRKSLALMNQERKLLIFPILSFLAGLLLVLLIIAGITGIVWFFLQNPELAGSATGAFAEGGAEDEPSGLFTVVCFVVFAVLYLVTMLLTNFFSVAFFSEIMRGLRGEAVSIGRGFRFALQRFNAILLWSLLASTVGVVLSVLEERAGLIGKLILKFVGVVWAVASVFAIPAIICDVELLNPFKALKRSAQTIRETWGESLIGFVGLQIITGTGVLLFVVGVVLLFLLGHVVGFSVPVLIFLAAMVTLMILGLLVLGYLVGVAQKIYIAALYLYANEESVIGDFTEAEIASAFRPKK